MDVVATLLVHIAESCEGQIATDADLFLSNRRKVREFCDEWGIEWEDVTGRWPHST